MKALAVLSSKHLHPKASEGDQEVTVHTFCSV